MLTLRFRTRISSKFTYETQKQLKKVMAIIKQVINKTKTNTPAKHFIVNKKQTSDVHSISNAFNTFFTKIGPSLARQIPVSGITPSDLIDRHSGPDICTEPTDRSEISRMIMQLGDSGGGYDGIPHKIVRSSCPHLIDPLVHAINLSLSHSIFPNEPKIARVVPIFKSGDPKSLNNYRPVSFLPVFSKLFEKIILKRLMKYIKSKGILYDYQFGFREKHSTNLALSILNNIITTALHNGDCVLGLFLDFAKAFDTIDHDILLSKLQAYGISDTALKLINSFLSNRYQYVDTNM